MILGGLIVAMTFLSPVFFTTRTRATCCRRRPPSPILAIGQLLVIVTRGIDLSVGSTLALASVVGGVGLHTAPRVGGHPRHAGSGAASGGQRSLRVGPDASPVHHHAGDAQHRARVALAVLRGPAHSGDAVHRADDRRRLASAGCPTPLSSSPGSRCRRRGDRQSGVGTVDLRSRWQPGGRAPGYPGRWVLISVYVMCGLLAA